MNALLPPDDGARADEHALALFADCQCAADVLRVLQSLDADDDSDAAACAPTWGRQRIRIGTRSVWSWDQEGAVVGDSELEYVSWEQIADARERNVALW